MGNDICCDVQQQGNDFRRKLPKFEQYQECQWPQNDKYLNDWMLEHNIHREEIKKHTDEEKYFMGNWADGRPSGKGIFYEPKEIIYWGDFIHGYPDGKGKLVLISINYIYQGEFKKGKAHGDGTYQNLVSGYSFVGFWLESKPIEGVLTLSNDPNVKEIELLDFHKGDAVIYYRDSRIYQGKINIHKLRPDKFGKVTFPQSSKVEYYEGGWNDGEIQGEGEMKWRDGSKYIGEYFKGQKDGLGTFKYHSGNFFRGFWIKGKRDGVGVFYNEDGIQIKKGLWKNGNFQEQLTNEQWIQNQKSNIQYLKNRRSAESSAQAKTISLKKQSSEPPQSTTNKLEEQNLNQQKKQEKKLESNEKQDLFEEPISFMNKKQQKKNSSEQKYQEKEQINREAIVEKDIER